MNTAAMKRQKDMRTAPAVMPASSNAGLGIAESTSSVAKA